MDSSLLLLLPNNIPPIHGSYVVVKGVTVTDKKTKYVRHTNQGHLSTKVTPAADFTDEPVIRCDVPVVENNFVDDRK